MKNLLRYGTHSLSKSQSLLIQFPKMSGSPLLSLSVTFSMKRQRHTWSDSSMETWRYSASMITLSCLMSDSCIKTQWLRTHYFSEMTLSTKRLLSLAVQSLMPSWKYQSWHILTLERVESNTSSAPLHKVEKNWVLKASNACKTTQWTTTSSVQAVWSITHQMMHLLIKNQAYSSGRLTRVFLDMKMTRQRKEAPTRELSPIRQLSLQTQRFLVLEALAQWSGVAPQRYLQAVMTIH